MSIQDDFKPYIDGYGLAAPHPVPLGVVSGSDNGPMFTAEMVMLENHVDVCDSIALNKIHACITNLGMLDRTPNGSQTQEGPDDYYGVLNMYREQSFTKVPREFLWATIRYLGALNNVSPGTWTGSSFLIRQPQLLCAMINAAFPSLKNPLHYLVRVLAFPLYFYSAAIISTSCMLADVSDSNSRRLGWHLQNNLKRNSILCYLASLIWKRRLYKDYPNGMQDVAAIYYYPQGLNNNPYSKYWTY